MQDDTLSCAQARPLVARYLAGEPCPELARHLEHCDACLDACLDQSLRRPADIPVPERFGARVLASLPAAPAPVRTPLDLWPVVAAACLPALLGAALWWGGALPEVSAKVAQALLDPAVLLTAGAIEMAFALLWAVRPEPSDL
jgi:hypothetical protein